MVDPDRFTVPDNVNNATTMGVIQFINQIIDMKSNLSVSLS